MLKISSLLKTFVLMTALQGVTINAASVTIKLPATPATATQLTDAMLSDSQSKKPEALGKALLLAALQILSKIGNLTINGLVCNNETMTDFLNSKAYAGVEDFCLTPTQGIFDKLSAAYSFQTNTAVKFAAIKLVSPIIFTDSTTTAKEQAIVFACLTLMESAKALLDYKGSYIGNALKFHEAIMRTLAALEIIFDNCAEATSCYIDDKGNICAKGTAAVFKLAVDPKSFGQTDDDLCTVRVNKNAQLHTCLKNSSATGAPEYSVYSSQKDLVLSHGTITVNSISRWSKAKAMVSRIRALPTQTTISQPIMAFECCVLPIDQLERHNKDLLVLVALHRALTNINELLVIKARQPLTGLLDAVVPTQTGLSKLYSDSALHIIQDHTKGCGDCLVEVTNLLHSLFGIELVNGKSLIKAVRKSTTDTVKDGVKGVLSTGISFGLGAAAYGVVMSQGFEGPSCAAVALATGMSLSQLPGLRQLPAAAASGLMKCGPEWVIDTVPVYQKALRNTALVLGVAATAYASVQNTEATLIAAGVATPCYAGYKIFRRVKGTPACRQVEYGKQVAKSPAPVAFTPKPAGAPIGAPTLALGAPKLIAPPALAPAVAKAFYKSGPHFCCSACHGILGASVAGWTTCACP